MVIAKKRLIEELAEANDAKLVVALQTIDIMEERNLNLGRALDDRKRQAEKQQTRLREMETKLDLLTAIDLSVVSGKSDWLKRVPTKTKDHVGIANLLLSDLHLDEVVAPAQMNFVNAYDRSIALMRMKATMEKVAEIAFDYITGIRYEGITTWFAGDNFSGNIHEELKETNEAPIMASFDYWVDPIVSSLRFLADAFGKVHVPAVVGNHGRNSRKSVMKNRVEDNFDWLLMRVVHRELASDERFSWDLPLTTDITVHHYDHTYLMTHGDQFRGGAGISGIQTPLALGAFKKSKRQVAVGDPFNTMIHGHFHQYMTLPGIIGNGSLKGYDEYAAISNFGFEVPQQAFWISTPERGPAFHVPVQPMNRKREGW